MSRSEGPSLAQLVAGAHTLADAAAVHTLRHFRKLTGVENKQEGAGFDPVTVADKAAEKAMRAVIRKTWPEHGILGEEFEAHVSEHRHRWVLDPIDGTRAYLCGFPLWGTLIGLLDGDTAVVGLMDQPYTGERFWAGGGKARFRRGDGRAAALATRPCARLADAVLSATTPDMFKGGQLSAFRRVAEAVRMVRYGGDCYAYAMLAAGQVDLVVEAGLKPVDIVALIAIIEQAGGRVTTWDGGSPVDGGNVVAAGDARVHEAALRLLSGR